MRSEHQTRLPLPDAAPDWPPARWEAAWIWSAEGTSGRHDYVYFRREFELESVPDRVLLRIAAERDATLWVNGELVGYGPPVSDPQYKRYETHEITSLLSAGTNCVAVRVYHDTGPAAMTDRSGARGLLCQLETGAEVIVASDETWRARPCEAYRKPGPRFGDSMWPEFFDAREDSPGWQQTDFEDSAWQPARRAIARVHPLWHEEQPQARFFPWVNLVPCETKPLQRIRYRPAALQALGEVLQRREASAHDTAVRMSLEPVLPLEKAAVYNAESLISGAGPATIRNSSPTESYETFDGLRCATVVLDFGRLMNARFGFRLSAAAGTVDIGYSYRLEEGRVVPYVSNRTAIADQYVARAGEQSWQTADWRHFRYVQLTFRDLPEELVLEEVWAEEFRAHLEPRGGFSSSDAKLERVFEIVRRTAELNVIDRTMDNPSRERKQYLGDCSGIVSALTSCFGDLALLRRYFANAREGQHPTGTFAHSYPGHSTATPSLFDHALSLPLRLREHYQLFADRELVASMWPAVRRLLELAESCLGEDSMMALPPASVWFDWGHMDRRGLFLPLQAMTAEVMRCSAELAEAAGEAGEHWAELARQMTAQIPRWFDEDRGAFVDAIVDGELQSHFSEHGNSLVAFWNLAPAEMIQSALDRWAANPGDFGQTSPGWFYLPGAFIRAGRPELAVRWMRSRLGEIERQGLDTWPETWCLYAERTTGSWRCRNSRAVAQGAGLGAAAALLQDMCGIGPAEPGFAAVRFAPQPGPLTSLAGKLPGPDGDYALKMEEHDGDWLLELSLPGPRRVVLDTAFAPAAREIRIGDRGLGAGETVKTPGGAEVGRFIWDAERRCRITVDARI
jgi:hypothetical protein